MRPKTRTKYLRIVQAHFYGASKWQIAEEMDVSPDTISRALQWYRGSLDKVELPEYLLDVIEETRNHIQHLWSYIRKLQDGLPEVWIESGEIRAEKRKHYPSSITQAHKLIKEHRQFLLFCHQQLHQITVGAAGEQDDTDYGININPPDDDELEEWERKQLPGEADE